MTRFCEFGASPYFNKHQDSLRLLQLFGNIYPQFTKKNCDRFALFQELFPGKSHEQSDLALLFTYVQRLLDQFLVQEELKPMTGFRQVLLMRNLRQRKLYAAFEKQAKKQQKDLAAWPFQNGNYYHLKCLTASESDAYYSQRAQHKADLSIQNKQNNLDYYYLSEKLKDACEMMIRSRILNVNYSNPLLEVLISQIQADNSAYEAVPPLMVYFHLYQLIKLVERPYYFSALEVVKRYEDRLPLDELQNIYNYLQNYCIEHINKGSRTFLQQSFELYKKQLEKKMLLDEAGFLSQWHYKNIVTIVLRLGEKDWVKTFIEAYRNQLPPKDMENAYVYNLAAYYYATKQLGKVQELLIQVEYKDIRYSLAAKSLLLRTYFDLREFEAFGSLVKSFRQYLRRNKSIPSQRRKAFLHLLQLTNEASLLRSRQPFQHKTKNVQQLLELKSTIGKTKLLINREWLVEKVEAMEEEWS